MLFWHSLDSTLGLVYSLQLSVQTKETMHVRDVHTQHATFTCSRCIMLSVAWKIHDTCIMHLAEGVHVPCRVQHCMNLPCGYCCRGIFGCGVKNRAVRCKCECKYQRSERKRKPAFPLSFIRGYVDIMCLKK